MTNLTDAELDLMAAFFDSFHAADSHPLRAIAELRELRVEVERLRVMHVGEPHQGGCLAYLEADYGVDYECSCGQSASVKDGDA